MTYTFKLARRLAVSRHFGMFACLALLAACAGETTGPEDPSTPAAFVAFRVVPGAVTVETNQPIRFRGENRAPRGELFLTALTWEASGGTIDEHGNFAAATPGTYKVVGRPRGRGRSDTSVVVVVPPQPDLVDVALTPGEVTLAAAATQAFSANGVLSDGSTAPIGVTWTADGGSIDPSGLFTAGSTPGAFRVIALHTDGKVADTAVVTITSPDQPTPSDPEPAPPAEPEPEPAPTLAQVILKPGSVSLLTGATKQFAVFGRDSQGDSVSVPVSYTATGGTITSTGLYTAGETAGTFRVVAAAEGKADTAVVTLTRMAATPTGDVGLPFGPFALLTNTTEVAPFTMAVQSVTASTLIGRIREARAAKAKLLLNMTGGAHENYLTNGVFDRTKWEARMSAFNTAELRQAVAEAVADGTIVGNSVMDEPHVSGQGDGNTWGPPGTMTKARVDSLCRYVKDIFPTLPTGVAHRHDIFEPTKSYRSCDFIISQYSSRLGSVTTFRDEGIALARRDGHAIMFAINILNGGTQDKDGTWDCVGTGGKGTFSPNCRMTPAQVRDYGSLLGPAGCGLVMWRFDSIFMANPDNQRAFRDVGQVLAGAPSKACRRS